MTYMKLKAVAMDRPFSLWCYFQNLNQNPKTLKIHERRLDKLQHHNCFLEISERLGKLHGNLLASLRYVYCSFLLLKLSSYCCLPYTEFGYFVMWFVRVPCYQDGIVGERRIYQKNDQSIEKELQSELLVVSLLIYNMVNMNVILRACLYMHGCLSACG